MYKGTEFNELWAVLQNMSPSVTGLLPDRYIEFVKNSMVENYEPDIDLYEPIESQKLSSKAKDLLASLYVTYWAEDTSERRQFCEKLHGNELAENGKDPAPMTEEEFQSFLEVFDEWNEMFGSIPFWARSRGWQPENCYDVIDEEEDADIIAGDLFLKIVYIPPEQRKVILEEAGKWVLVEETEEEEELYWHDDDSSGWKSTSEREDFYRYSAVIKDGHFYGALVYTVNRWGMGMSYNRDEAYGVLAVDGSSYGRTEEYESRTSSETSHSKTTRYSLRRKTD